MPYLNKLLLTQREEAAHKELTFQSKTVYFSCALLEDMGHRVSVIQCLVPSLIWWYDVFLPSLDFPSNVSITPHLSLQQPSNSKSVVVLRQEQHRKNSKEWITPCRTTSQHVQWWRPRCDIKPGCDTVFFVLFTHCVVRTPAVQQEETIKKYELMVMGTTLLNHIIHFHTCAWDVWQSHIFKTKYFHISKAWSTWSLSL